MNNYLNIEEIINAIRPLSKQVAEFRKLDGITIECGKGPTVEVDTAINEIKALCNKLKLLPVSIEKRKDDPMLFTVQFPELVPKYTDEQIENMYKDTFNFLFSNIKMKDPTALTKSKLIENMSRLTKHAITTYYRSNVNQYKESVEDYYNDKKYRAKIDGIFLVCVEEFLSK